MRARRHRLDGRELWLNGELKPGQRMDTVRDLRPEVRQTLERAERFLDLLRSGGSDYPMELLRTAGVDFLTIGQYLQPTRKHAPIDRFVHPDEFRALEEAGQKEVERLYRSNDGIGLIAALTLGTLVLPTVASGQVTAGMPRIGTLAFGTKPDEGIQILSGAATQTRVHRATRYRSYARRSRRNLP